MIDLNGNSKEQSDSVPGISCNPLSDAFSAVDYLKHRTPLYQVNTINIDDMYSRKGELSTAHFVVGDWRFRVLVYPFGVDNPSYSLCNNSYMSVYLHYLGRADDRVLPTERIVAEFRCTIHSCLGSQHDLYQELQHKFAVGDKTKFLSGFSHFLPLSLLFRTPFYLFPDPNAAEKESASKDGDAPNANGATKRNMAILKTELWIFPPLDWHRKKAAPKEPIYIDLLDDSDDDEAAKNGTAGGSKATDTANANGSGNGNANGNGNGNGHRPPSSSTGPPVVAGGGAISMAMTLEMPSMPTLERDENTNLVIEQDVAEKEGAGDKENEENSANIADRGGAEDGGKGNAHSASEKEDDAANGHKEAAEDEDEMTD